MVVPGVNSFNPEIAADKFGSPERYLVPADTGEIQNTARHNPIRMIHGTLAECRKFCDVHFENNDFVMCGTPELDSLAYMFVV